MNYMDRLHLDNDGFIEAVDQDLAVPPGKVATRVAKTARYLQKKSPKRMPGPIRWQDAEGHFWTWKDNAWVYTKRDDFPV